LYFDSLLCIGILHSKSFFESTFHVILVKGPQANHLLLGSGTISRTRSDFLTLKYPSQRLSSEESGQSFHIGTANPAPKTERLGTISYAASPPDDPKVESVSCLETIGLFFQYARLSNFCDWLEITSLFLICGVCDGCGVRGMFGRVSPAAPALS
jgi:hypothetical protein